MLTKKDIKNIVAEGLGDFFEDVLAPYLDREHKENKEDHERIRVELGDKIDAINEHLRNHEKRISKLEDITSVI